MPPRTTAASDWPGRSLIGRGPVAGPLPGSFKAIGGGRRTSGLDGGEVHDRLMVFMCVERLEIRPSSTRRRIRRRVGTTHRGCRCARRRPRNQSRPSQAPAGWQRSRSRRTPTNRRRCCHRAIRPARGDLGGQPTTPQLAAQRVPQFPPTAVVVHAESSATDQHAIPVGDPPFRPAAAILLVEVGRKQTFDLGACLGPTVANLAHRHRIGVQAMQVLNVAGQPGRDMQSVGCEHHLPLDARHCPSRRQRAGGTAASKRSCGQ